MTRVPWFPCARTATAAPVLLVCLSVFAALPARADDPVPGEARPVDVAGMTAGRWAPPAAPAEQPWDGALLRDLGGARRALAERGLDLAVAFTTDGFATRGGASSRGRGAASLLEATLMLETERAGWWRGGRFVVHGHWHGGASPAEATGAVQAPSSIESPSGRELMAAFYEQQLGERVSLLVGLYDLSADFGTVGRAGLFVHSSAGTSPEFSQVGPSVYPVAHFGARLKVAGRRGAYAQAAWFRGLAAADDGTNQAGIPGCRDNGPFWAVETGWAGEGETPAKIGVGAWRHGRCFATETGPRRGNAGAYVVAERTLWTGANGRALGAFVQAGGARGDRNAIGRYQGAGVVVSAPFASRPDDQAGLAVLRAEPGAAAGAAPETAVELSYAIALVPGLALQPALQYIRNPGLDPAARSAWILGLRTAIAF